MYMNARKPLFVGSAIARLWRKEEKQRVSAYAVFPPARRESCEAFPPADFSFVIGGSQRPLS